MINRFLTATMTVLCFSTPAIADPEPKINWSDYFYTFARGAHIDPVTDQTYYDGYFQSTFKITPDGEPAANFKSVDLEYEHPPGTWNVYDTVNLSAFNVNKAISPVVGSIKKNTGVWINTTTNPMWFNGNTGKVRAKLIMQDDSVAFTITKTLSKPSANTVTFNGSCEEDKLVARDIRVKSKSKPPIIRVSASVNQQTWTDEKTVRQDFPNGASYVRARKSTLATITAVNTDYYIKVEDVTNGSSQIKRVTCLEY